MRDFCKGAMKRFVFLGVVFYGLFLGYICPANSPEAGGFRFTRAETAAYMAWVWPHAPHMDVLNRGLFPMIHMGFSGFPMGTKAWHHAYGFPELGITILYADLGYPEVLGHAWGAFPHISIPLFTKGTLSLNLRYGLGLAWLTQYYSEPDNERNIAISNPLNILMNTGLELHCPLSDQLTLRGGFAMTHFSNGKTRTPNKGLNVPALKIALSYAFSDVPPRQAAQDGNPETRSLRFYGALGYTRLYPAGGPAYAEFALSTTYTRQLSQKVALGLGADLFWGFSDREVLRRLDQQPLSLAGLLKPGLHFAFEQWFGQTAFVLQQGLYLYAANNNDGKGYNRIGFRHQWSDKWLISLSLKSHLFRADFIEWGMGYRIL